MILELAATAISAWLAGLATPRVFRLVPKKPKQPCPWCGFGLRESPIYSRSPGGVDCTLTETCECCDRWVSWDVATNRYQRWSPYRLKTEPLP